MILRDLFAIVDPKDFAIEYLSRQEDGGKDVTIDAAATRFKEIFTDILARDVKESDCVLLGCDVIEIYGVQSEALLFEKQQILDCKFEDVLFPTISDIEGLPTEELERISKSINLPSSYGYEFSERAEILGYSVDKTNIEEYGLVKFLVSAFEEMFFFGSEENMHREKEILIERVKEFEKIKGLPQEEQERHFVSFEEVYEGLCDKFDIHKKTPDEETVEQRKFLIEHLKNQITYYNLLTEYKSRMLSGISN